MIENKKIKCCIDEYSILNVVLYKDDEEVFITAYDETDDSVGESVCLKKNNYQI